MNIAVFPGSFDPMTKGHEAIIRKALPLFDKIYVAIGINSDKNSLFPLDRRIKWMQKAFENEKKIEICTYKGLTTDFCKQVGAKFLIRGLRNAIDFQYEHDLATANQHLYPELETIFLVCPPELAHVSSSLVRELYRHHADYSEYVSYDLSSDE